MAVEKYKFYQHESPLLTYDLDSSKIVVSSEFSFGKKGCLQGW